MARKLCGRIEVDDTYVGGAYVILRTSWVYSNRRTNFVLTILRLASEKKELKVVDDQAGSPIWASVKPITSDQYPLPARRPHNPITNKEKVKRVFGVEMSHWEDQLRVVLVALPGAELNQNYAKSSFKK